MSFDLQASLAAVDRQNAEGCVKTWEDLERYRTIIERVHPDLLIECGTFSGKSALWFARQAGATIGGDATVITIDTDPHIDRDVALAWLDYDIDFIPGSSTDPEIVKAVTAAAAACDRVMVVLDSDHSGPHVLAEMEAYGPLVTSGSYMVVEDTLLHWMPDEERRHYDRDPLWAVGMFMTSPNTEPPTDPWQMNGSREWKFDYEIESMHPVTQFPSGWLRRR